MLFLYNIGIQCYHLLIRIVAFFSPKARLWINGRRDLFSSLKLQIDHKRPTVWMHCASLGEFEQGRPLLEAIRMQKADIQIVLSFFSPSGYEIRKEYEGADVVTYLPLDTRKNATQFLEVIQPDLAIFVKYEFWYHHLNILANRTIPTYLISAIFREQQWFFKPIIGAIGRQMLHTFDSIFVQNEASKQLLQKINYQNVSIAGDTRIDRVLTIADNAEPIPIIENFVDGKPTLVIGSSWTPDEEILLDYIHQHPDDWQYVFAPHDIADTHLDALKKSIKLPFQSYSDYQFDRRTSILLIDNIGLLSRIYQYGTVAYIGGGFGEGIHSILEPAAFHLPILFGPNYQKFQEADMLVASGGAFVVKDTVAVADLLSYLQNKSNYVIASRIVENYIQANKGATATIFDSIQSKFCFLE